MNATLGIRIVATGVLTLALALPSGGGTIRCRTSGALSGTVALPSGGATIRCRTSGALFGSEALNANICTIQCRASGALSGTVALASSGTISVIAWAVLGQTELASSGTINVTAWAVLGQTELASSGMIRCRASGDLSGHQALPSGGGTIRCRASGALSGTVALVASPSTVRCMVSGILGKALIAPSDSRVQILNGKLVATVRGDAVGLRMSFALDDHPDVDASLELLNPDSGSPFIWWLSNFSIPNDAVTHLVTVSIWREFQNILSLRQNRTILFQSTIKTTIKPPKTVKATLLRDWTTLHYDLTRISWDWGDNPAGMVEIWAYIRPLGANKPRMKKNLIVGVASADIREWLIEGIGPKILSVQKSEPVYFGVSCYYLGNKSSEIISDPVVINAIPDKIEEPPTKTPDEESGTAIELTINDLINWVSAHLQINQMIVSDILLTSLIKIKDVVSKGGSVELDDFGKLEAFWINSFERKKPITGDVTTVAAQRNCRFIFNEAFRVGTQQGKVFP